jgi:hypothetical protein
MVTRRAFNRALVAAPLLGLPRPRISPPPPTGYVIRIPDFERWLEFPNGVRYPARMVLHAPVFDFEWSGWFTARQPGSRGRCGLMPVDYLTGDPPRINVLSPGEIELYDGRYLWTVPREFHEAALCGARFMLDRCPLALLVALTGTFTNVRVLFGVDVLTPTFDPHPEFGFPGL